MNKKVIYKILDKDKNEHFIEGTFDSFKLENNLFNFLEEIIPIELHKTIPQDKIDIYSNKGLVKSLRNEFNINDVSKIEFCRFSLNNATDHPGVYIWVLDNEIIYIGETYNLKLRFDNGYGLISPRNPFKGGQSTNCKMNRLVHSLAEKNKRIKIFFCDTSLSDLNTHKTIEKQILRTYKPPYNYRE